MKIIRKILILLSLLLLANAGSASMSQFVKQGGKITLSTDGCSAQNVVSRVAGSGISQNDTCSININKPNGATVNKAILLAAADVFLSNAPLLNPVTVRINGTNYRPDLNNQSSDLDSIGSFISYVRYDDVTAELSVALNSLSSGTATIQLVEEDGLSLEGMQLFVIWNDPATVETVIGISLGTIDTFTGINETIATEPIDTTDPLFKVTSGTSIVYSTEIAQSPDWRNQTTNLSLNGTVFATKAGGYDDGFLVNGALFTADGEGVATF